MNDVVPVRVLLVNGCIREWKLISIIPKAIIEMIELFLPITFRFQQSQNALFAVSNLNGLSVSNPGFNHGIITFGPFIKQCDKMIFSVSFKVSSIGKLKQSNVGIGFVSSDFYQFICTNFGDNKMRQWMLSDWNTLIDAICASLTDGDSFRILILLRSIANKLFNEEEKYGNLNAFDDVLREQVLGRIGGYAFLRALGFVYNKEGEMQCEEVDNDNIQMAIRCINFKLASLRKMYRKRSGLKAPFDVLPFYDKDIVHFELNMITKKGKIWCQSYMDIPAAIIDLSQDDDDIAMAIAFNPFSGSVQVIQQNFVCNS